MIPEEPDGDWDDPAGHLRNDAFYTRQAANTLYAESAKYAQKAIDLENKALKFEKAARRLESE